MPKDSVFHSWFESSVTTKNSEPHAFLSKLDLDLLFALRNPIVMASRISNSMEDIEEYLRSGEGYNMAFDEWIRRKRLRNADQSRYSYFGSNGTAPMAKEKDALGKLFEKYRGK